MPPAASSVQLLNRYILAVDDLPDNLLLLKMMLESAGYRIELVDSGPAALSQIQKAQPDLVILDVMMPGMSGYEVTQKIRNDPQLPYIPILLISAHERSSVVKGLDAGADDFIILNTLVQNYALSVRDFSCYTALMQDREVASISLWSRIVGEIIPSPG